MKKMKLTWLQMHKGIMFGKFPLWNIPVNRWVLCILHMNLRIVGGMFNALVRDYICETAGSSQDQKNELYKLLRDSGVWIKEKHLDKKKLSLNAKQMPKVSFIGRDTETITTLSDHIMEIVHPKAVREEQSRKGKAALKQYERSMACWAAWKKVWRLLNTDLDSTSATARADRVSAVAEAGQHWLTTWLAAHKATQGLYIHLLVKHLPDLIREFGDLRPYQSQGLEHAHSRRKKIADRNTNKRTGESGRTAQAMGALIADDYCNKAARNTIEQGIQEARSKKLEHSRNKRIVELAAKGIHKTAAPMPSGD